MPWITLQDGEVKYIVSKYAKEELPTWNEVYNEFYLSGHAFYNSEHPHQQELDPYWKLPRLKVLIATVCNQLNKMLYEDGYRKGLLEHLSKDAGEWGKVIDAKFILEPIPDYLDKMQAATSEREAQMIYEHHLVDWVRFLDSKFIGINCPPPIYTIPNPNGTPNPFITNDHPRIDISTLAGELKIQAVLKRDNGTTDTVNSAIEVYSPLDTDQHFVCQYKEIMAFMIRQYRSYFDGVPGWKDRDGNPIPADKIKPEHVANWIDPAL